MGGKMLIIADFSIRAHLVSSNFTLLWPETLRFYVLRPGGERETSKGPLANEVLKIFG